MTIIGTAVGTDADASTNRVAMEALVAELRGRAQQVALGGPEASRTRHVARGKLLPREQIGRASCRERV